MKTAMQELVDSYEKSAIQYLEMKQINKASLYFRLARWAKEYYLEKEKEQILNSYVEGRLCSYNDNPSIKAEQYYNETYQNK